MLAVLTETGLLEEVSIIIKRRLSSSGLMKRINSESSLWRKVLILVPFSPDLPKEPPLSRRLPNSPMTHILVTSLHAQPTLVLHSEVQFTLSFLISVQKRIKPNSIRLLMSSTSKSEESMESTLKPMTVSSISPTEEDLEEEKLSSSKTCTMVLKP